MRRSYIYRDLLNDDFAGTHISPKDLKENYRYDRNNPIWMGAVLLIYNIIARPIVYLFIKVVFRQHFVNKDKLNQAGGGYYIYANHTGGLLDAFCPNIADFSRNNSIVVGPDAMSIKGLNSLLYILGAIPLGSSIRQTQNMKKCILGRVKKGGTVTIYPERHIWPYYTDIRPFSDDAFAFPANDGKPVYTLTNCYTKGKFLSFPQVITYIDGPFYADCEIPMRQRRRILRDQCYKVMKQRCDEYSIYEYAEYIYDEFSNDEEEREVQNI